VAMHCSGSRQQMRCLQWGNALRWQQRQWAAAAAEAMHCSSSSSTVGSSSNDSYQGEPEAELQRGATCAASKKAAALPTVWQCTAAAAALVAFQALKLAMAGSRESLGG
jgi:hypothetical protein